MTIYCKSSSYIYAIDEVRAIVGFCKWMNESFNQSLTTDELIQLHRYYMQAEKAQFELPEFPDMWTEVQLQEALAWDGTTGRRKDNR